MRLRGSKTCEIALGFPRSGTASTLLPRWAGAPLVGVLVALIVSRPVRLRGTENRHKGFQKSPSELGSRRGLSPPFATVSGRAKSYRPRKLICRQISGERWAISALSLLAPWAVIWRRASCM
jgi:hypothetical protein